jgi:uncharacterized RmlC-like cupin family protein
MTPEPTTCVRVRPQESHEVKQALTRFVGISAENAGAQRICMHISVVPPGGRGKAHLHQDHETTIYVISGEAGVWYGEKLGEHVDLRAGDFFYIPANLPHLPYNLSQTEPCTAVIARTDPNEEESVVLLPELDGLH